MGGEVCLTGNRELDKTAVRSGYTTDAILSLRTGSPISRMRCVTRYLECPPHRQ